MTFPFLFGRPPSPTPTSFPTKMATAVTSLAYTGANNYAFALPASINAGDRLVLFVSCSHASNSRSVTTPAGWTLLWSTSSSSDTLRRAACFEKIASGSEGSTVTVTFSGSAVIVSGISYRFSGVASIFGTSSSWLSAGRPDPPLLEPGIGIRKFYWIAFAAYGASIWNINAAPSSYSNLLSSSGSSGGGVPTLNYTRTAERQLEVASENPGTFGTAGSTPANYAAIVGTVALRG